MALFDFLKRLAESGIHDRRRQLEAASFQQEDNDPGWSNEVLASIKIKDEGLPLSVPDFATGPQLGGEAAPDSVAAAMPTAADDEEDEEEHPPAGGIYAVQERNGGLYRLVKVVHAESGLVHVVRYAGRFADIPAELAEAELSLGVDEEDGSFGAEHLPLSSRFFAANSVHIQDGGLSEAELRGCRLYLDSIFDCLGGNAPQWLRKAGSYAAWRADRNAMAALADRYLVGVDLPMDSKKALYWLNRIVQQGIGIVQPGEAVRAEHQILAGGLYACPAADGSWTLLKVLLNDRQGVQLISFPAVLKRLPQKPHPARLAEQAAQPGKTFTHAAFSAAALLESGLLFAGLLPVSFAELRPYRAYLREVYAGSEFQRSAFHILLQRAEAGDTEAQHEIALLHLSGDPEWELERNIPEAVRWLTEAANLGHGPAAHSLALLCRSGAGEHVPPDPQLSFEWLLYAAQLNHGPAQLEAAACCLNGQGCPCDPALAHAWLSAAASRDNGLSEAEKRQAKARRQEIDAELPAAQKAKARDYFRQLQDSC